MYCHNCGERMIGDGYSVVLHCPNAEVYDVEPDANPVHCCEFDEEFDEDFIEES